jgi:hypothetical protein
LSRDVLRVRLLALMVPVLKVRFCAHLTRLVISMRYNAGMAHAKPTWMLAETFLRRETLFAQQTLQFVAQTDLAEKLKLTAQPCTTVLSTPQCFVMTERAENLQISVCPLNVRMAKRDAQMVLVPSTLAVQTSPAQPTPVTSVPITLAREISKIV